MDEETRRIIIGVRLEKCKEDLQAARELLRLGFLRAAVNRAYYGVFYADELRDLDKRITTDLLTDAEKFMVRNDT